MLGGFGILFVGVMALVRGNWFDAVYTGGGGVVLVIGGALRARRGRNALKSQGGTGDDAPHPVRWSPKPTLIACGLVIGAGVLVGVVQFWRTKTSVDETNPTPSKAELAGVAAPGDYHNPYFGFRVRYGADWQDVTAEARKRATERLEANPRESTLLLALAWSPVGEKDRGASLLFGAESLSAAERTISGAEYLRRMSIQLQQRRDGPREIKEEPQAMIGGRLYARLSFTRPWDGSELRMTYWVTLKHGHAAIIAGTYNTPEALQAIETLLARVSEDTVP
jgi:hypothetical protein